MKQTEPDFWVLEYVTITKDPRTDLVVAIGGTDKAADILREPAASSPLPDRAGTITGFHTACPSSSSAGRRPQPRTPCSPPVTASTSTPR
ncbi:hypothetical protein [Streptomyces sp. FXY-T5]|uniref:hypothetical protein n=1 Tax=Streptomyces sp. FXY-T5 TaxID=3064901 RepID=UPI0027D32D41|nr:hypothetical protein [Streptomyces sp. FXY-T5]WMD05573.1 hypothetical protein Q7C01_14740 [Streptomyces sp. FXY-T5]